MEWHTHFRYTKYEVNKDGIIRNKRTKRQLKIRNENRYSKPCVNIYDNFGRLKFEFAGILILEAINKTSYENVDYIDGDFTNHSYSNLKPVSKRILGKRVAQFSLTGEYIKTWNSCTSTHSEGFNPPCVHLCCNNRQRKHAEYLWCYEENVPSFEFEVLVAKNKNERIDMYSTKEAYLFIKSKIPKLKFDPFKTNLSKYKNTGREYCGYIWEVEKRKIQGVHYESNTN